MKSFLDVLNLVEIVKEQTRLTFKNANLIDHIITTDNHQFVMNTKTVSLDLNKLIFTFVESKLHAQEINPVEKFKMLDINEFYTDLIF